MFRVQFCISEIYCLVALDPTPTPRTRQFGAWCIIGFEHECMIAVWIGLVCYAVAPLSALPWN